MIDPELQNVIDAMVASGFKLPEPLAADTLRALMDNTTTAVAIEVAEIRDIVFAGPAGAIAARLYHPRPGETLPVAIMLHGGGWVIGSLDTHDGLSRALAQDSGCALLSIDYRRAPEHPFPAPLEDRLAVIAALPNRAEELGIDPTRWAVTGDSAGGNLATAVALKLRGRGQAPMAQVLFYPVTDNDFTTPSYGNSVGTEFSPDLMRASSGTLISERPSRTSLRRRCARRTSPGWRRRPSSLPAMMCCTMKVSRTRCGCGKRAFPPICMTFPAASTALRASLAWHPSRMMQSGLQRAR